MQKPYTRSERKKHRFEDNRLFILGAAERVFLQKGYTAATMDDIAKEAQFSKATLYSYFKGKSEIFSAVIFDIFDEIYTKLREIQEEKISASEKLRKHIYTVCSFYQQKKNIVRIFFTEEAVKKIFQFQPKKNFHLLKDKEVPESIKYQVDRLAKINRAILIEGIDNGEFRNVDVDDASMIYGGMIRGLYFGGFGRSTPLTLEKSVDMLHRFFLYGISKDRKEKKGEE
ncbi:MAG: TetR/AcrR family transcriptional regulator [Candidatus Aminicenantes bacterium]|nr:TetR/AcrR family transcriptional regulator [Candidatus Aminicenantes bacterium]